VTKMHIARWASVFASVSFAAMLLPAWILEIAGLDRAMSDGTFSARPLGFISSGAFIGLFPLALVAAFAWLLPRPVLVFGAFIGGVVLLLILSAAVLPRSWRISAFPAKSDAEAWEHAKRQIASGNSFEWTGRANGKIIWYQKGVGTSKERLVLSISCSIPLIVLITEIALRRRVGQIAIVNNELRKGDKGATVSVAGER
jgi:hypothetical protein